MATKPPPTVQPFPSETQEKIAYESVSSIPTVEPNDRNRLGYHVWLWLTERNGTLKNYIKTSGSRMLIPLDEAYKIIAESLRKQGREVSE